MGEPKRSARRLKAKERQLAALELRKGGKTYEEIAKELGYRGKSGAFKAVELALKDMMQEPADEVRRLELSRLDKMLDSLWWQIGSGKHSVIEKVLKIMDRRAKLLGLDAPARRDITTGGEPIKHKAYIMISPDDWDDEEA